MLVQYAEPAVFTDEDFEANKYLDEGSLWTNSQGYLAFLILNILLFILKRMKFGFNSKKDHCNTWKEAMDGKAG